jgi:ABC-2 type transport system permease protein
MLKSKIRSTFCQNQQQSALASFLFMFPAMMFSGLMFPLENMPTSIKWIAFLDPLSHYLGLLRNIMLKGGCGGYVATHIGILAVMTVTFTWLSFRRFHTRLQ